MLSDPIYRAIATHLSPAGSRSRLSILIYHRVQPEIDPIFPDDVTAERFDLQLRLLKQVFNILPLPEAIDRLKTGTLPARPACITFDDGYADNAVHALPILQQHGLHATFFIATAYLNGGRMFNDTVIESIRRCQASQLDLSELGLGIHPLSSPQAKRQAIEAILPKVKYLEPDLREETVSAIGRETDNEPLPDGLMMTTAQLRQLHDAGMEIGGHTHRHPILARLDDKAAHDEIQTGIEWLERTLGNRIRVFAYPNGKPGHDYLPGQAEILRKLALSGAVSTRHGVGSASSDPFQLPRFTPWSPKPSRFIPMLLRNLANPI